MSGSRLDPVDGSLQSDDECPDRMRQSVASAMCSEVKSGYQRGVPKTAQFWKSA